MFKKVNDESERLCECLGYGWNSRRRSDKLSDSEGAAPPMQSDKCRCMAHGPRDAKKFKARMCTDPRPYFAYIIIDNSPAATSRFIASIVEHAQTHPLLTPSRIL
jgi:hypothetical protein